MIDATIDTTVAGIMHRESDFVLVGGIRQFGTCGPNALHGAATNALGRYVSTVDVYTRMLAAGLCDPGGASTISGLRAAALNLYNLTVTDYRNWATPWPDWQQWLDARMGSCAVIVETENGQALVDYMTGAGENARNLKRHFIVVYGRHAGGYSSIAGSVLPAGYWCADGASFAGGNRYPAYAASNTLQFYTDAVMAAASLSAGLAIEGAHTAPIGGNMPGIPTGWTDDGTTLTAPNGIAVVRGFRAYILNHAWDSANYPLAIEYTTTSVEWGNPAIGAGSRQDCMLGSLGWTTATGVYVIWVGQDIRALAAHNATLDGQLRQAAADRDAATAALQVMQGERDTATAALAAYKTTAGKAVDVLTALKAVLGGL